MLALAAALAVSSGAATMTQVQFKASDDGVAIAAEFIAPRDGKPTFVLLHGVAAGRGEWAPLAAKLAERGYGSLAVDFRGHGGSGGPSFKAFRTSDAWLMLERDIRGALAYLDGRGIPRQRQGLAGASIGANLAARVAAAEPKLACVALLSPGIQYQGIGFDQAAARILAPLAVAAAPTDRYAYETLQFLRGLLPRATFLPAAKGHGAQMLADGGFTRRLLAWMDEKCVRRPASSSPRR